MKLQELGEFGFIGGFSKNFNHLLDGRMQGIGDDCAVFPANDKEDYVVSTDLLVEGTHFLLSKISFFELGQKSLAVNLSDLAAMGATPFASFLSLGVPKNILAENLIEFMNGYQELSEKHKIPLLGGDTTSSTNQFIINVCVVGKLPKGKAKLRSAGKVGDIVCISGHIGDSAGGLQVLLQDVSPKAEEKKLISVHHNVVPKINEGIFLGKQTCVNAMIDLSDGLASDLVHILEISQLGAQIEIDKLPISQDLQKVCSRQSWSARTLAVAGGEDYQLLFTITPDKLQQVQKKYQQTFGEGFYPIGKLIKEPKKIVWTKEGKVHNWHPNGFDHFNKKE